MFNLLSLEDYYYKNSKTIIIHHSLRGHSRISMEQIFNIFGSICVTAKDQAAADGCGSCIIYLNGPMEFIEWKDVCKFIVPPS